jgi:hypothetical protein
MEVLCAICSGALGNFVSSLEVFACIFNLLRILLCLSFLVLLVFSAIIKSFVFADETGNVVAATIGTVPSCVKDVLQGVNVHCKFVDIEFPIIVIIECKAFLFYLLTALFVKGSLAEVHAVIGAFRLFTKGA